MVANLLLVDSRVESYQQIIQSLNSVTECVLFDFKNDTLETLLSKINNSSYESVGLLQHNYNLPTFQMLKKMNACNLNNNNDFSSWDEFKDFIVLLKNQKQIQNFDMIACALYSNSKWKSVLDYLENNTGVNIRASIDNTGTAILGGNWFLETDNINLKTVYFTDAIDNYKRLLGASSNNSGFITNTNELYVWGDNSNEQLGSSNSSFVPTLYPNMSNVKAVSFGNFFILILKTDGTVFSCGINSFGQLGNGNFDNQTTPVQVLAPNGEPGIGPYLSNIIAISAGGYHSLFLDNSGNVFVLFQFK